MAAERDERLYLSDIVAAVDRILQYTAAGRQAFLDDQLTQDAGYFRVDLDIIWEVVATELPRLRSQIAALLAAR